MLSDVPTAIYTGLKLRLLIKSTVCSGPARMCASVCVTVCVCVSICIPALLLLQFLYYLQHILLIADYSHHTRTVCVGVCVFVCMS